jgi:DNA-directed RNA polymerase subunit E'/Rpb7
MLASQQSEHDFEGYVDSVGGDNGKKKDRKDTEIREIHEPYIPSILSMKIILSINEIGRNIKQNLERMIVSKTEGKCIVEGYIRPDSVRILTYSSGKVHLGTVEFHTTFECMVCHPVEGMLVKCICKTITKAGIHAEVVDKKGNTPITVFVARDHHILNHLFEEVVENSTLIVSIIGVRFELNDSNICAIGTLKSIENKEHK